MIEVDRDFFNTWCADNRLPLEAARDAVVKETNEIIFIDETQLPNYKPPRYGLGDYVAKLLAAIGITPKRFSKMLGRSCGCNKRKQKLNEAGDWIMRFVRVQHEKQK